MRKKSCLLLGLLVVILFTGITIGYAIHSTPASSSENSYYSPSSQDLLLSEDDSACSTSSGNVVGSDVIYDLTDISSYETIYSVSYDAASSLQKQQLENIPTIESCGSVGTYVREIMLIMDILPADTPRITLEDAISICDSLQDTYSYSGEADAAIVTLFNEIAGAPDFQGGSGTIRSIYMINEEGTEYIRISLGRVRYINENTGDNILIYPLDGQANETNDQDQ